MISTEFITILILIAGGYLAWSIGANDVANAMGTSVGSGALTLRQAVCAAAIFEFAGAFFFGSQVSETMQSGIVNVAIFTDQPLLLVYGMLSALFAAAGWLQLASYYGWPVSTTHSIVGAITGFGLLSAGLDGIYWEKFGFILTSWVISPIFGAVFSFIIFNFLRKRVFFAQNPLQATQAIMPWLAGLVVLVLVSIVFSKVLKGQFDLVYIWLMSLLFALLAVVVGRLLVSRMAAVREEEPSDEYSAEMALELDKARRHLNLIARTNASSDELRYRTTLLMEEINNLSRSLKRPSHRRTSQYSSVERLFGYLQIMSACLMAFAHGANDVSNAVGPIVSGISTLQSGVVSVSQPVPVWALALGGAGIVIGLATWGWRVIETIGKRITDLTPSRGFSAEFGAAATILVASAWGLPISTTHTLVGAVLGVGFARGLEALDMSIIRDIAISWLVTVPIGAIVSMLFFTIFTRLLPLEFG